MSKRVKVTGRDFFIQLNEEQTGGVLNGKTFDWDVSQVSESMYHVLKDGRSYNVEVLAPVDGISPIKVNGNVYEAETIDKFDELLKSLGMEKGGAGKVNDLKAPMPGLVLKVEVSVGADVKKGDRMLVLEAMKMENVIKAPADAKVASVEVKEGTTVEKNQVMVRFN